jgi:hypothetical protein
MANFCCDLKESRVRGEWIRESAQLPVVESRAGQQNAIRNLPSSVVFRKVLCAGMIVKFRSRRDLRDRLRVCTATRMSYSGRRMPSSPRLQHVLSQKRSNVEHGALPHKL